MLTIYKASAGSGKTFSLTRRYLTLLLGTKNKEKGNYTLNRGQGGNSRSILAVTFTNKATEEMKRRVVTELALLAFDPEKSNHTKYLAEVFGLGDDVGSLSEVAGRELKALLFNFADFNISTIDSFFQRVLRSFAAEINRPGNFDIELDSNLALAESADAMFSELSNPDIFKETSYAENLTRWLMQYIRMQIEEGNSFNIFNREGTVLASVVRTIDSLMNEKYSLNSDRINAYLDDPSKLQDFLRDVYRTLNNLYGQLRHIADNLHSIIESEVGDYAISGCKIKEDWLLKCAKCGDFSQNLPSAAAREDFDANAMFAKTSKGKKCVAPTSDIIGAVEGFVEFYKKGTVAVKTLKAVERRLFYLGILGPILKVLKSRCLSNNTILIQDTNEFIHKIIGNDMSPFVYDKVGTVISNYLIDEFQDTSRMQWDNFRPLVLDSLATNSDNLIIGDEKQCIYRFRNSEPELLGHKVKEEVTGFLNNGDIVCEEGLKLSENTNYRSASEIIKFNNTLFSAFGRLRAFSDIAAYRNVIQDIPERNENFHGHIKMQILATDNDDNTESLRERALDIMVSEVARLLEVFRPQDIAILTRTNSEASMVMASLLEAMEPSEGELPVLPRFNIVSGQALQVGIAKSVKMIVDILRIVDSPASILGKGETIRGMSVSGGNNFRADLARLVHNYHIGLSQGKDPDMALADAASPERYGTDPLLDKAMRRQSYDLIGTIERVIAEIPDADRIKDAIFIAAFQDCVISYMERGGGDIHSFLDWWDKTGAKTPVDSPSGTDSLTISTVHKSKGMEYRCVIIPFVEWNFVEESNSFRRDIRWYDTAVLQSLGLNPDNMPCLIPMEKTSALANTLFAKEYHTQNVEQRFDNLNITYVAFTRAIEELSLITYAPQKATEPVAGYICEAIAETPDLIREIESQEDTEDRRHLLVNLQDYLNPDTGILEIGKTRTIPYEIELRESEQEELSEFSDEERERLRMKSEDNKPEEMPHFKSVDRREALRLGKIVSQDRYDPEQTRLQGKFGLSKIGTVEEFEEENARVIGNFLHEVMSMVYSAEDLEYALEVQSEKVMLPEELKEKYLNLISEALKDPRASRWFRNTRRVLTERPLSVSVDGGPVVTRRPDRVVWTNDGTVEVVDFKFGKPHQKEHSQQVAAYVRYLKDAGESNVSGHLWYINQRQIIDIDASDLFGAQ